MTDIDKVLRRIKKMLAMAEGQANPNESAVAAAMAEKLMRKYNLQHADVLLEELADDSFTDYQTNVKYGGRIPTWVQSLIVNCAHLHDCEARYNYEGRKKVITFLGELSDVTVCAWVFEYLMAEIRRHTNTYAKSVHATGIERDTFCKACASEVGRTLQRMRRQKEEEMASHATGTALVVRKRDMITEKYKVSYRSGRRGRLGDVAAAYAGAEAGRSISVRQGVAHEGGRKAIK